MRTREKAPPQAHGAATAQPIPQSGLTSAPGQRLPVSPRERKPILAVLAVLLILGGALASGLLIMRSGNRVSAIALKSNVAAGSQLPQSALREVQIADTGINYIPWRSASQVTKHYAAVDLLAGTLLTPEMVALQSAALAGKAKVGLALKPGQMPPRLSSGERVNVYYVGTSGTGGGGATTAQLRPGQVLASAATVIDVSGEDTDVGGGTTMVTITVGEAEAPLVALAASSQAAAVAIVPPGNRG